MRGLAVHVSHGLAGLFHREAPDAFPPRRRRGRDIDDNILTHGLNSPPIGTFFLKALNGCLLFLKFF
jgi:hypothetical protein